MQKKSVIELSDIIYTPMPKVKIAKSFLNIIPSCSSLFSKMHHSDYHMLPTNISKIIIDNHALERWNSRVGPIADKSLLQHIFESIILCQRSRIKVLDNYNLALLDDEIAFGFMVKDNAIIITTYFGRVSLNPSLANIDVLRSYNRRYNEHINLNLNNEVLMIQKFPQTSCTYVEFEDDQFKYRFDYFMMEDNSRYYISSRLKKLELTKEKIIIDLQHPNRTKLHNSELYMLGLLGHTPFLASYMKSFEPERFQSLYNSHSKRAIHRFSGFQHWKRK